MHFFRIGIIFSYTSFCNSNPRDAFDFFALNFLLVQEPRWQVLFSYPGRDVDWIRQNSVRQKILDIINSTQHELILFIYGLTDESIIDAIRSAMDRGVQIRIVADKERDYSVLRSRNVPYEIWRGGGLHHPKILISDRRYVFTGTGNFTTQGLLKDFDSYFFAEILQASDIQKLLTMLDESGPPILQLGNMYFLDSPRNGVHIQKWLLDSIRNSRFSIDYMIYSHFDPVISWELIRAARRGVRVRGIYNRPIDPEGVRLSGILPSFGSEIYMEKNEDRIDNGSFGLGGLLHHKTMIVDNSLLLTGSYNYSRSARDSNRELFQITWDRRIIQEHIEEFQRVLERSAPYREEEQDLAPKVQTLDLYREWGGGIFHSIAVVRNSERSTSLLPISSGLYSLPLSSRRSLPGVGIWFTDTAEPVTEEGFSGWDLETIGLGRDLNSNEGEFPKELSFKADWNQIPILTWNSRAKDGVEFRIDSHGNWGQVVFWSPRGSFYASSLKLRRPGLYFADFSEEVVNQSAGFLFFRKSTGEWDSLGCFQLGQRTQPSLYRFYLIEAQMESLKSQKQLVWRKGFQESCSLIRRSGD